MNSVMFFIICLMLSCMLVKSHETNTMIKEIKLGHMVNVQDAYYIMRVKQ